MIQHGTLTVLYRQTSSGTFGGGDANVCDACPNICCTSGDPNCDKSTGDGSGGQSGPPGSTTDPGGNIVPRGMGGTGSPPGSTTIPGGNTVPGGISGDSAPGGGGGGAAAGQGTLMVLKRQTSSGTFGGGVGMAGMSVAWSIRRTDRDATVVSPVPSCAASKSTSIAMAAGPAKITCITRRR